jgi:glycosyltransferase involved in cell wall biosynthesis
LAILGNFSQVICVSQETAADLAAFWRENGHTSAPVTVFGWPVNHAGAVRHALPPPSGLARPSVLCVGTFEPRKNHLVLLEAARLLWERGVDFELVLIGRTTAHWGGRVLAAIEALQAAGRPVRWLRHVDDATLAAAYRECAFTVFPSVVEGFGLPILESLWHGRPCVCGGNGAIGEAAAGGGCLLVDQGAAAPLADGIERLLADSGLAQSLFKQAASRSFATWEMLAGELLPMLRPE